MIRDPKSGSDKEYACLFNELTGGKDSYLSVKHLFVDFCCEGGDLHLIMWMEHEEISKEATETAEQKKRYEEKRAEEETNRSHEVQDVKEV